MKSKRIHSIFFTTWNSLISVTTHGMSRPRYIQLFTQKQLKYKENHTTSSEIVELIHTLVNFFTPKPSSMKRRKPKCSRKRSTRIKSTSITNAKKVTGATSSWSYSAWKSLLVSLPLSHLLLSMLCSFMDCRVKSELPWSLVLGWDTPGNKPSQSQWWSWSNAATWCGMRRTSLRRKFVTECCRKSFGNLSFTKSFQEQVWPALCILILIISTRSSGRSLRNLTSSSRKAGMSMLWSRRSSQEIGRLKLPTTSEQNENFE